MTLLRPMSKSIPPKLSSKFYDFITAKGGEKAYFYPKFELTLTCLKSLFPSVILISFGGPCDPECSEVGCDGPGPDHCNDCLHYYYKLKNNTR